MYGEERLAAMDDLEVVLEKLETADHAGSDTSENIFRNASALELVETSSIHILHAVIDAGFYKEGTVKFDNLRSNGTVQYIEFHENAI
jgi:hypothetical protein